MILLIIIINKIKYNNKQIIIYFRYIIKHIMNHKLHIIYMNININNYIYVYMLINNYIYINIINRIINFN